MAPAPTFDNVAPFVIDPRAPDAPPFTLRRLLVLWIPLAFTFLLMSGSSPIVSAGITRLPDAKQGLAAFCDAFRVSIFLHAPLFVVRDIAIRSVKDRASYMRMLYFVGVVAAVCSALEFVVALTPVGSWLLIEVLRTPANLVSQTQNALIPMSILPLLIGLRGIHQGVHIRGETASWVGFGTALRMAALALVALVAAPHLDLSPAVMGATAFLAGLVVESIVNTWSALRRSPVLAIPGPDPTDDGLRGLARFALPLMLANLLGVLFQPLVSRVAGGAGDPETSKAGLQILISWVWFFSSTLFAMQALVIAHARDREHLKRLAGFGGVVAGVFSAVFLLTALVPAARDVVLVNLFGVVEPDVHAFVSEALPLTVGFPVIVLARALLRGLIVRSGKTGWVVLSSVAGVIALVIVDSSGLYRGVENGCVPAAKAWLIALAVEGGLSVVALASIGLKRAFQES